MDRLFQILREVKQTWAFMRAFVHGQVVPDPERGGANIGAYKGFCPRTGCSRSWERWCKHSRLWGLSSTDRLFRILIRGEANRDIYEGFCLQIPDLDKKWQTETFMMAFVHRQVVPDLDKRLSKQTFMMGFIHREVSLDLERDGANICLHKVSCNKATEVY